MGHFSHRVTNSYISSPPLFLWGNWRIMRRSNPLSCWKQLKLSGQLTTCHGFWQNSWYHKLLLLTPFNQIFGNRTSIFKLCRSTCKPNNGHPQFISKKHTTSRTWLQNCFKAKTAISGSELMSTNTPELISTYLKNSGWRPCAKLMRRSQCCPKNIYLDNLNLLLAQNVH